VHSYFAIPDNPDHAWAEADFGSLSFAAAVRNGVIFGTQFHPEKSGEQGLELLHQFVQLY
jgi:glutamine amidotransferase